mgnify:CR=1 FL=1
MCIRDSIYPFKRVIREAGMLGVMSSYNDYDGIPVQGSYYWLTTRLRGEMGFRGYVVSDSDAVEYLYTKHGTAKDMKEAVRQSVEAGLNVRCTFRSPDSFVLPLRELVKELTGCLAGVRLPEEAVPRCPDCGRVLVPWVRDDTFLEGTFWQDSLHRYHRFLRHWIMDQSDKKVLLLELGVGEMTPSIIKLPFWELTAKNENVFYACLNREAAHRPEHLRGRSLYLQGDLAETLAALRQERSIAATIK